MSTENPPAPPETKGGIVPYLMQKDAGAASEFYQRAFGAEEVARMTAPGGTALIHVHVYINGHSLMMNDAMPAQGRPYAPPAGYALTLIVQDIDMWFKRAVDAGCTVATTVETMFWGDRYGEVIDPFGIRWSMNQPAKRD